MNIIIRWLISAAAIIITAYILSGVSVNGIVAALVLAVVLGIINAFIRPILVLLTLPISIVTLGLFTLVINAVLIMLAAKIVPGVTVENFWWALIFGVVLALVHALLKSFDRD